MAWASLDTVAEAFRSFLRASRLVSPFDLLYGLPWCLHILENLPESTLLIVGHVVHGRLARGVDCLRRGLAHLSLAVYVVPPDAIGCLYMLLER